MGRPKHLGGLSAETSTPPPWLPAGGALFKDRQHVGDVVERRPLLTGAELGSGDVASPRPLP